MIQRELEGGKFVSAPAADDNDETTPRSKEALLDLFTLAACDEVLWFHDSSWSLEVRLIHEALHGEKKQIAHFVG